MLIHFAYLSIVKLSEATVGFRRLQLWETRKLSMAIYLEKYIPESNVLTVDHLKQTTYIILHLLFNPKLIQMPAGLTLIRKPGIRIRNPKESSP